MIPNRNAYEYSTRDSTPLVIEGGGSEGEYNISFADVTIIEPNLSVPDTVVFGYGAYLTNYIGEKAISEREFIAASALWLDNGPSKTYKLALLNGVGIILLDNSIDYESITINGDAELCILEEDPGYVKVTGQASITFDQIVTEPSVH